MSHAETTAASAATAAAPVDHHAPTEPAVESTATAAAVSPTTVQRAAQERVEDDATGDGASAKGDSEAETIIEFGKNGLSPEKWKKPINDEPDHEAVCAQDDDNMEGASGLEDFAPAGEAKSRKRKRIEAPRDETLLDVKTSSPRSSLLSSPAPDVPSEHSRSSGSASTRRSSLQFHASASQSGEKPVSPKRRLSEGVDVQKQRRARRTLSQERSDNQERRGTRSATYTRHSSNEHSQSPPARTHKRLQSAQSGQLPGPFTKKRRLPPPLLTSQKRSASEATRSGTSSANSSPSPPAHRRKFASGDDAAFSPAKMLHTRKTDASGRTGFAKACASRKIADVRQQFKDHPEELNIPDNAQNTPLQTAALAGHLEIVGFLLENGCEVDTKNDARDTPLIDAVENGHFEVVKQLLEHGANPRLVNEKGQEPYELANPDDDNYEGIRRLITAAKAKDARRRRSEDHQSGRDSAIIRGHSSRAPSAASQRDSPPTFGPRSPPVAGQPSRRKIRERTRNDLFYTDASPETLQKYAAKGDMGGVTQVVEILGKADAASLIAAVRGGHDEVLGILLAIGNPDPDPSPVRGNDNLKTGYNTPMLAAIGRGNLKIIRLLLDQAGFDATRRDHKGRTYSELAVERRGDDWEAESGLLQQAAENHRSGGRRTRNVDPPARKVREREGEPQYQRKDSTPPIVASHRRSVRSPTFNREKDHLSADSKRAKDSNNHTIGERRENIRQTGGFLSVHEKERHNTRDASSEASIAISEDETARLGPPRRMSHKTRRSQSDVSHMSPELDNKKPQSLHTKERKSGHEKRRKIVDSSDSSAGESPSGRMPNEQAKRDKSSLKRSRSSPSPELPRSRDVGTSQKLGDVQKKKRRVVSEDSPPERSEAMRPSKPATSKDGRPTKHTRSASYLKERRLHRPVDQPSDEAQLLKEVEEVFKQHSKPQLMQTGPNKMDVDLPRTKDPTNLLAKTEKEREREREAEVERERRKQAKMEADAIARERAKAEEEAARIKLEEEAARQQAEKEEAELHKAAEEAAAAARKKAEDEAAKKAAEEALRRKAEEEAARRRADEEARKERQRQAAEKAERDRQAREERVRQEQRRRAEDAEKRRRENLPGSLCRVAEMIDTSNPERYNHKWLKQFSSLLTVTSEQIDPRCSPESREVRWLPNFQVAALVVTKDLGLNHLTQLEKKEMAPAHRLNLWRTGNMMIANNYIATMENTTFELEDRLLKDAKPKFLSMEPLFWVRLSDFLDLIPHQNHLGGLTIRQQPIVLAPLQNGINPHYTIAAPNSVLPNGIPPPSAANGIPLVNGFIDH